MASIILDIVMDETLEEYLEGEGKDTGLTLTVIREVGGCGWPEIKFEGPKEKVEAYLRRYCDNDDQEFELYRQAIIE